MLGGSAKQADEFSGSGGTVVNNTRAANQIDEEEKGSVCDVVVSDEGEEVGRNLDRIILLVEAEGHLSTTAARPFTRDGSKPGSS